jgi:hypothetical protein
VADLQRNYRVAYDALLEKAMKLGEARAIRELKDVGPPPYADGRGYAVQRRWSNLFEGADFFIASMIGLALNAPDYRPHDIHDWFDGQVLSAERLVPQTSATSALTAKALGGDFAVPVFVVQGGPRTSPRQRVSPEPSSNPSARPARRSSRYRRAATSPCS